MPNGSFDSSFDSSFEKGASQAVGGTLSFSGDVARALTMYRAFDGTLTPSGVLTKGMYEAFGGSISPNGTLSAAITIIQALCGTLDLDGALSGHNPDWLLIDEDLMWMGEWSATHSYDIDDVVLHKYGNEWHVFVSKVGHNVGNAPNSSAVQWHRLYQEQLL